MIALMPGVQVFLAREPVDMRKSIDGLNLLVAENIGRHPQSGDIFVFWGNNRRLMKALVWDRNGFILHYKRLEKGRFHIPTVPTQSTTWPMTPDHFAWFMAGLDFETLSIFPELSTPNYC